MYKNCQKCLIWNFCTKTLFILIFGAKIQKWVILNFENKHSSLCSQCCKMRLFSVFFNHCVLLRIVLPSCKIQNSVGLLRYVTYDVRHELSGQNTCKISSCHCFIDANSNWWLSIKYVRLVMNIIRIPHFSSSSFLFLQLLVEEEQEAHYQNWHRIQRRRIQRYGIEKSCDS